MPTKLLLEIVDMGIGANILHTPGIFPESDELSSGDWADEKQSDTPTSPCLGKPELLPYQDRTELKHQDTIDSIKHEVKFPSDYIPKKARESLSIPLPTMEDLSPEFKKKLDEWKKIKKTPTSPTASKDETQSHFISRWRPGGSHHHHQKSHEKQEHNLHDEFYKKLEEWQMLKGGKRSRSHSDRGQKDERDPQTPSPGLSRKNSKGKKSGKGSGSDSHGGSIKEKEGRSGRKTQKEKDLMWLEKELQKIEREKLRLEREREKYLEREAR